VIKRNFTSVGALVLFVGLASGSQVPDQGANMSDAEFWLDLFLLMNNCNSPTPVTLYLSESKMVARGVPTYGQQINNFCYDNSVITYSREVPEGIESTVVVGNDSYCHELTFLMVREAYDWRLVPGTWHSDTSYVDPWVAERRNISHPECPNSW